MKRVSLAVLPEYVTAVLNKLNENGHSAYLVGGCVRDLFLGRKPYDYDVATSMLPEDVMRLFDKAYPTGIRHGTVTVRRGSHSVEITTLRNEGVYSDGRRPDSVVFSADIETDLERRDFTINAMAWSESTGLIDPFCGERDIADKIIRCVGDAKERFHEDPLRILRAWRFSGTLGFQIAPETAESAMLCRERLTLVSPERISAELGKLLTGENMDALLQLINYGFLERFGLKKAAETLLRLSESDPALRYRAVVFAVFLMHTESIPDAGEFLYELRFDRKTVSLAKTASRIRFSSETEADLKRVIAEFSPDAALCAAFTSDMITGGTLAVRVKAVLAGGDCVSLSSLSINGEDLKALGAKTGKEIGWMLQKLLCHVLSRPQDNNKETLIKLALSMKK